MAFSPHEKLPKTQKVEDIKLEDPPSSVFVSDISTALFDPQFLPPLPKNVLLFSDYEKGIKDGKLFPSGPA